jgi:DNA-binding PadR family transcriptional regulator
MDRTMSTTRMMILGLVSTMQPVHGYDVRRELLSWRADEWANIHPGSIYHALKRLAAEGLLREVATERVGSRPARTTYEITPVGRDEFETLLRRYWWEPGQGTDPFQAALAFLPDLSPAEAVAALRNRAQVLRGAVEFFRTAIDSDWARQRKPVHVTWQFERSMVLAAAEADWCDRIAGLVEGGVPDQDHDGHDGGPSCPVWVVTHSTSDLR